MLHGWQFLTDEDRETILRGIADGEVHGGPFHLELDWVDKCNARCFFCNSADLQNGRSIPWPRTLALLEEARAGGLRSLRLSGGGEPTLHPDLPALLEWMAGNDVILDHLNTNGAQLNERLVDALAAARVHDVRVSLNYVEPEIYSTGMGLPAKFFGRVCEGIKRLDAARRRPSARFGTLSLQFFVYKPTIEQIPEMARLGKMLGADRITLKELYDIDPALQYDEADVARIVERLEPVLRADWAEGRVESLLWSRGAGPAIQAMQRSLAEELGTPHAYDYSAQDHRNKYCYIAWYSMTIIGSQAVYPCCFYLSTEGGQSLGSLENNSLQEVWRGPVYTQFRREFRRYHLLGERLPMHSRRNQYLLPGCASHDVCPLTYAMADEDFYAEADRRLDVERRRPANALWRIPNLAGRRLIDAARGGGS